MSMAGIHGATVEVQAAGPLELTQDEAAVIRYIRETPYGEVTAKMRSGLITSIRRSESFRPPSLRKQQPKLLSEDEP